MNPGESDKVLKIIFSQELEGVLVRWKKKDASFFADIEKQINRIIKNPLTGKPLRHTLKNRRRVHIGSFVLIYELHHNELRFLDLDHHDRIYKK